MPSIEFHGYTEQEALSLLPAVRKCLEDLPYTDKVVFCVPKSATSVTTWAGESAPFLRVLCNPTHAAELRARLTKAWDVEILGIEFFPRSPG